MGQKKDAKMKIGYIRYSNEKQRAEQLNLLKEAGCNRIFEENVKATSLVKPELAKAYYKISTGDKLIVASLDRLGSRIADFIDIVKWLDNKGGTLISIKDDISGKSFLRHTLALFRMEEAIKTEKNMIRLEVKLESAGRPKVNSDDAINAAVAMIGMPGKNGKTMSIRDVAKQTGLSKSSLGRYKAQLISV